MNKQLLSLFEATEEDIDHPLLEDLVEMYKPAIELKDEDILELDPWDEDTLTDLTPLTDPEDEVTDVFIPITVELQDGSMPLNPSDFIIPRLGLIDRAKDRHVKRAKQVELALEKLRKKEEKPTIIRNIQDWMANELWAGKCPK